MQRLSSILLSLTAAASLGLLNTPATAADSLNVPAGYKLVGTLDPSALPASPPPETAISEIKESTQNCRKTPADSKQRSSGVYEVCTKITGGIPKNLSPALKRQAAKNLARFHVKSAKSVESSADATCTTTPGTRKVDRGSFCEKGLTIEGTTLDVKGIPIGESLWTVDLSYALSTTSTTWNETISVQLTAVVGTNPILAAQLAQFNATCAPTACSVGGDWATPQLVGLGETVTKDLKFSMPVTAGDEHVGTPSMSMLAWPVAGLPLAPAEWKEPNQVRCDAAVGNSQGCVHPDFKAEVVFPVSKYGAAAATYDFAQKRLIDAWGTAASPLRRLADDEQSKNNRTATCEDNTFIPVPDETVSEDSCDEYPFARTEQGGTAGLLCAEVVPQLQANGTYGYFARAGRPNPTGNEKCIRGHVPFPQNRAAGAALGTFASTSRIMDGEAYLVAVVA